MRSRSAVLNIFAIWLLLALASAALAADWEELTPQQQDALQAMEEPWDELDDARREQLLRGAERWTQMDPEQQA